MLFVRGQNLLKPVLSLSQREHSHVQNKRFVCEDKNETALSILLEIQARALTLRCDLAF